MRIAKTEIPVVPSTQSGEPMRRSGVLGTTCIDERNTWLLDFGTDAIKQPLTIRIDPTLLAGARECAVREHRTLTNLIEAVLRERIAAGAGRGASTGPSSKTEEGRQPRDA